MKAPESDRYYTVLRAVSVPAQGIAFLVEAELTLGFLHTPHTHEEVQIIWLTDGALTVALDDERLELQPGALCVIPQHRLHTLMNVRGQGKAVIFDLRLTSSPVSPLLQAINTLQACGVFAMDRAYVQQARAELSRAFGLGGIEQHAWIMSVLWRLVGIMAGKNPGGPAGRGAALPPRFAAAEAVMHNRMAQAISVEDVARAVSLSRSQLTRLYLEQIGIPPAERLRRLRVEHAAHLLRTTLQSVKEIAFASGFSSSHHLGRVFQRAFGLSPEAYRYQHRDIR